MACTYEAETVVVSQFSFFFPVMKIEIVLIPLVLLSAGGSSLPIATQALRPATANWWFKSKRAAAAVAQQQDKALPRLAFTPKELVAIRNTYDKVLKENGGNVGEKISLRALAVTVLASNLDVAKAARKYAKFLRAVGDCGVERMDFVDGAVEELTKDPRIVREFRQSYKLCGADHGGGSIMWIHGEGVDPEREASSVRAGILYWLAVVSMREGITLIIDASKLGPATKRGNEGKLQRVNQSYPLRPRSMMICGAPLPVRVFLNSLFRATSVFTGDENLLRQIRFEPVERVVREHIPTSSAPRDLGGRGGGVENIEKWVKDRVLSIPVPSLAVANSIGSVAGRS